VGYTATSRGPPSFEEMEPNSPAEELPALYRAILDRVAELEAAGHRVEAAHVRRAATRAYSRAWDARAHRQLEALLRRAQRPGATGAPHALRAAIRSGRGGIRPPRAAAAHDR
jgi:hypothetical protein